MHIFKEIEPLRTFLGHKRADGQTIGLVPTMGALHAGHISLIGASRAENSVTVCSIYVNPAQFNNSSDLDKYPRMPQRDIAMLADAECDAVFLPDNTAMYPAPAALSIDFGQMDKVLEGKFRPGHFSGVGLVVSKLLNIVMPDRAYFGQKDYQQVCIIQKLIDELCFPVHLRRIATMREADGLAMSSRNLRLTPEQRTQATVFYRALSRAKEAMLAQNSLTQVNNIVNSVIQGASGVRLEYFEAADRENLNVLENVNEPDRTVLLIAGFIGEIRLIDNMLVSEK